MKSEDKAEEPDKKVKEPRPGFDAKGRRIGKTVQPRQVWDDKGIMHLEPIQRTVPKQHLSKKDRRRLKLHAKMEMMDALNKPSKPLADAVEELKKTFEVHAQKRTSEDKALAEELVPELPQKGDTIQQNLEKTKKVIARIKAHKKENPHAPSQEGGAEEVR